MNAEVRVVLSNTLFALAACGAIGSVIFQRSTFLMYAVVFLVVGLVIRDSGRKHASEA